MARDFDETAQEKYQDSTWTEVTGVPLTSACWFSRDVESGIKILIDVSDTTSNLFRLSTLGGPGAVRAAHSSGGSGLADTTANWSTDTWHHAAGIFRSTTDRSAFIDGGNEGNNTTSISDFAPAELVAGNSVDGGGNSFAGAIAEVAVWNIDLDDGEIASLGAGVSPLLIRPQNLVFYAPLIGQHEPEIDLTGRATLVTTGSPNKFDHPRVFYPTRSRLVPVAAAAAAAAISDYRFRQRFLG